MVVTSTQSPSIIIDSGNEQVWYDLPSGEQYKKRKKQYENLKQQYKPAALVGEKEGMQFKLKNELQQEYCIEVSMLLSEIAQTQAGVTLFQKINSKANNSAVVTITMPEMSKSLKHMESGTSPNQTIAGAGNFYGGMPGVNGDTIAKPALKEAFESAVKAMGQDRGSMLSKYQEELNALLSVRAQFTAFKWAYMNADIPQWYEGKWAELSGWQSRYVAYMVAAWMKPGDGSSCCLKFDPWNELQGTSKRAPIVGLYHELCHACYYLRGETIFDDFTFDTELVAIGMGPFKRMPLTQEERACENWYRKERAEKKRDYI